MLWKETEKLTCAVCGRGQGKVEVTVVCNYSPAGNIKDNYKQNVSQSLNRHDTIIDEKTRRLMESGESLGFRRN